VLVVLVMYLIIGALAVLIGAVVLRAIAGAIVDLIGNLPEYAERLKSWFLNLAAAYPPLQAFDVEAWVASNVDAFIAALQGVLAGVLNFFGLIGAALGGALSALFVMFMALYLTVDGPRIREYVVVFFPQTQQPRADRLIRRMGFRLGRWAIGQAILCVVVGGGAWLGLHLLGVPYAPLLGLVWALAEFVPGIGPFISAVPSIILGFTVSPVTGVLSAIFCLVWSQLENNYITPRIMGQAVEMHALVILGSLLIGGELLGFAGALLAVPVAATLAVIVDEFHGERRQEQLALQPDAADDGTERAAAEPTLSVSPG
jgi:predicted PurR-regulated permease PerM